MPAIAATNKSDNMDCYTLSILASVTMVVSGWSFPFYPVHRLPQIRVTRFAPVPRPHRFPIQPEPYIRHQAKSKLERPKPDYDNYDDEDKHNHKKDQRHKNDQHDKNDDKSDEVIGPVHTFVKTDKNANYKWGVRHHVGNKRTS